jgi:hypothetical protein
MPFRSGLPLPAFVLRPLTALILAGCRQEQSVARPSESGLPTANFPFQVEL